VKTSEKLRKRRKELDLTQATLAEKAGISVVQYNGYERNRHEPSETTMAKLAKVLKADPDDLWDDEYAEEEQTVAELREALRKKAAEGLGVKPSSIRILIQLAQESS
jgi:transcriptional regulator with XRE-family HTH domain